MKIEKDERHNNVIITHKYPNGSVDMSSMPERLYDALREELFGGELFNLICNVQQLAWKDDDMMDQDTLFEMQEKLCEFVLRFAGKLSPASVDRVVKQFPWLYQVEEE